jgi:hypothetical protein
MVSARRRSSLVTEATPGVRRSVATWSAESFAAKPLKVRL